MPTAIKEEVWEINDAVTGITEYDLAAKTADGSLQTIVEYPVPVGYSLVFRQEDTISAYLEDDGVPAECLSSVKVDIVIMDSAKQNVRSILNMLRYGGIGAAARLNEFADVDKLVHLDITPGDAVIAREGERVCIRANCPGAVATIDTSDCYYRLTCRRIRHTLFT